MTVAAAVAHAPAAPGRLGVALDPTTALRFLEALGVWRDQRRAELDRLDEAAQASADGDLLTGDILLSMALWKAVADRDDLLVTTWDSGRVGRTELERMSALIWGRLDATLEPTLAARADAVLTGTLGASGGALALSLPEACRLSDALASSLRARLGLDADEASTAARLRSLRATVERVRDQVATEPATTKAAAGAQLAQLDERLIEVAAKAKRGADVGGLLGPLEADAARAERDLIVASATRVEAARDAERASRQRTELVARGEAVRALAARCVATVTPAPRLAVPDVAALGPVPTEAAAVDAYLRRLSAVSRALGQAQTAYQAGLDERSELAGRLEGYAAKAAATPYPPAVGSDLAAVLDRGRAVLSARPADLGRARSLVAAYQAYLGAAIAPSSSTGGRR